MGEQGAAEGTRRLDKARGRLRQRYLDGLPGKITVLEQGLDQDPTTSPEASEAIRRLAHQIAGSAASFGFPELGALAKQAELAAAADLQTTTERLLGRLRRIAETETPTVSRVLVIDDDIAACELVEDALANGRYDVRRAASMEDARQMLRASSWDLVLLDLILPDGDGRDLLVELRNEITTADTPVLVLSARTHALVKNECAAYAVDGFLEKPVDTLSLPALIANSVNRRRSLQRAAYTDELTELLNRQGFRDNFQGLLSLCRRNGEPMTIAILDADHFKSINDEYGHDVGDIALRSLADSLRENLRSSDLVGRWGGEEFVIAMPHTDARGGYEALTKVAEALAKTTIAPGNPRSLTFSAGVTEVHASEWLDLALLRADQMLYSAKRRGRNRILHALPRDESATHPRVLVAEDDLDIAGTLIADLGELYDVVHVLRGDDALERARREDFDLIILDHDMPGLTGVEVAEALSTDGTPTGPVLVLTTAGDEELIERAFAAGAVDYVTKPYRKRELLARLGRYVAANR